jgi:NAD(P)-dependent dehydrogenase (short-subunit alcohol dehydrogenase family)
MDSRFPGSDSVLGLINERIKMEKVLKRFTGKNAFVTGAGSGIGRGISLRLAQEGTDIAVCDIDQEKAKETVSKIEELGQKAIVHMCDVGKEEAIYKAVKSALESLGKIDILVNCAGIGDTNMSFEEIDPELWDRIYSTNVKGPFFLSKFVAMNMIKKKIKGRIINISSTEGKTNRAGSIAYSSSKHALIGLTQGLAIQLAPHDITVNAICPGLIDTPIWHKADKDMDIPMGSMVKMVVDTSIEQRQLKIARVGTPDDIAGAVAFLASEDASYMTGQAINVCGGLEFH